MKKLLIIPLLLILTGCWNYRELNELAITTGIALDIEDDQYKLTVLIANSKKSGSSGEKSEASTAVYEGVGQTLYEALKDCASSVSKQVYLGHLDILILSEDVAKLKTNEIIDFLFRYPQSRNDFQVVIAKDSKASDILKITTPLESFPSQNVSQNLEVTGELQGFTYPVTFNEFVKLMLQEGINPILPSVKIVGNVDEGNKNENLEQSMPQAYLKLDTLGLFKDSSFITWANQDESFGINIINSKVQVLGISIDCRDKKIVSEITQMKSSIEMDENLKYKIKVDATGGIQEVGFEIDLEKEENIKFVKEESINKIKDYINQAINLAKDNQTDIFGLGTLLYRKDPNKWNEIKDNFEEDILTNLEFDIEVNINLESKGKINNYIGVSQ